MCPLSGTGFQPVLNMGKMPMPLSPERIETIIVAAGRGTRLQGSIGSCTRSGTPTMGYTTTDNVAKSMRLLGGKPLFAHAVETFQKSSDISGIIVVVGLEDVEVARHWIQKLQYSKVVAVVSGGKERSDSVQEGLKVVAPNTRWIAIHDGARPFVTSELVSRVLSTARICGAAIPVLPVTDTIKEVLDNKIIATIPRKQLFGAQTPQVFDRQRLVGAYQMAKKKEYIATDDAEVVQHFTPGSITIVPGEENNFKITTLADWERAEDLWKRNFAVSGEDTT